MLHRPIMTINLLQMLIISMNKINEPGQWFKQVLYANENRASGVKNTPG